MPIAEIADARTGQQAVDIARALLEPLGRRADEDEGLIGCHVHSQIESPAVRLTHNRKLRSTLQAKTPAVDGAVRSNGKVQLAAQLARHIPLDDDACTGAEADGGDDLQSARRILLERDRSRPLATKNATQRSQQPRRAEPRNGLPPRDPGRHLA
jgi:hypothetical protein